MSLSEELTPTLVATTLGIKNYKVLGAKGDLAVILTQTPVHGTKDEPALLLANRRFPKDRHTYIPLSALWQLVIPTTSEKPTRQWQERLRQTVMALTERLYGFVTQQDAFRVQDAIYEFAEDLQEAPPPAWMTKQQWLDALAADDWGIRLNGQRLN